MTSYRLVLLSGCATLAFALGVPAAAQAVSAPVAQAEQSGARAIVAAPQLDRGAVEEYARDALIAGTDSLAAFDALAADKALPGGQRAMAGLAGALAAWRGGDLDGAMARAARAVEMTPGFDGYVLMAELAALRGDTAKALAAFRSALPLAPAAGERTAITRKIALLDPGADGANIVALAQSGAASPSDVAAVLALSGDPAQALRIGSKASRKDASWAMMLAEQALQAGDLAAARDQAWQAVRAVSTPADKRYALALLTEAAGDPDTRRELADRLATLPHSDAVDAARIALLMRATDYEAALALLADRTDPASRDLRLELLRMVGDDARIAAEYEAALAAHPNDAAPYVRLALLRMSEGDEAAADALFDRFFATNPPLDAQVEAARQMLGMGLDDAALTRLEGLAERRGAAVPVGFVLFDALLARGDDAAARAALERVDAAMGRNDPVRADLADAWDRLGDRKAALAVLSDLAARGLLDYDRQVQVAQFLEDDGQVEAGLAAWQKLWRKTELPARRSFLETRIVRAAQKLGTLDTLAASAEKELASGGGRSALELLVAIRMAQGERKQARDAVARFAASTGMNTGDRLRQLVTIYARTGDYAALDDALAQLARLEPDHADIYLRQRILAVLNQPGAFDSAEDQQAAIDALIAQLESGRGGNAEAASRTAAIYELASLNDRAIESYRRAVALSPGYGENFQQLVKLLGEQGQSMQAVTVASYGFVNAPDAASRDRAADALLSVARAQGGEDPALSRRMEAARGMLRRALFEQVLEQGAEPAILSRIADVAAAGDDQQDQLLATELMLPWAGDQRADILRRLITMTSPRDAGAMGGASDGNAERKAEYGRRLIALRVEYPPEVYADIGTTLLQQGDPLDAARAFALMNDLGGLVNVDEIRAGAYEEAGLFEQALARYATALLHDRTDPALIVATSILREALGEEGLAHRWYREGLETLIARQPILGTPPVLEGEQGLEIRRYYSTMLEGRVLTATQDTASDASLDAFTAMLDTAIAQSRDLSGSYAEQARLRLAADTAFRLATARGDADALGALREALRARFGDDPLLAREMAYRQHLTGLPASAGVTLDDALAVQARDSGNFFLATHLALAAKDGEWLGDLLNHAIEDDARERARRVTDGPPRPPRGLLLGFTLDALAALPPQQFRTLVWDRLPAGQQRDALAFDILRATPSRYDELQQALGFEVIDNARLIDRIESGLRGGLPLSAQSRTGTGDAAAGLGTIIDRFSTGEKIELYERLVDRIMTTGIDDSLAAELFQQLVRAPLSPEERSRLETSVRKQAVGGRGAEENTAAWFVPTLLLFDVPEDNRPVLYAAADALARRFPDGAALPEALRAWYAGDPETALAALHRLHSETRAEGRTVNYLPQIEQTWFADQVNADLERFLAREDLAPEDVAAFYDARFADALKRGIPDALALRVFRHLAELDPGNAEYLSGYLLAARKAGAETDRVALLRDYLVQAGEDRAAAMALSLALLADGRDEEAGEVARAAGVPFDDAGPWQQALQRAKSGPPGRTGMLDFAGFLLADILSARRDLPLVDLLGRPAPQRDMPGTSLVRAVLDGEENGLRDLRMAWRHSAQSRGEGTGASGVTRGQLADSLARAALAHDAPPLPPAASALVVQLLGGLDDGERGRFIDLYRAAARGYVAAGRAPDLAGSPSHAMHLRLAIAEAGGRQVGGADLLAFLHAHPILSARQRLYFASALGRDGETQAAVRLIHDAALQTRFGEDEPPVLLAPERDFADADAFTNALACWTDTAAARGAYEDVRHILEPVLNRGANGGSAFPPFSPCHAGGTVD